jgi:hypothetical protein
MHARQQPLYDVGSSARVVNMRTLTTHIGLVMIAVTAPEQRKGKSLVSNVGESPSDEWIANSLVQNREGMLRETCESLDHPRRRVS